MLQSTETMRIKLRLQRATAHHHIIIIIGFY